MVYKKKYMWLLIASLITLFVPYIYICQYAMPFADDFVYGFRGKKYAVLQESVKEYFNWSGRYTANVLDFLNPLSFNSFIVYKLVPVVVICFTVLSWFIFIHVLFGNHLNKKFQTIISLFLSLLFVYQMPILSEGIYWYTGAVTYQIGNVSVLVYISLIGLLFQERFLFKNKLFHFFILSILLIACIGFNEILMLALASFAVVSLIIVHKNGLAHKPFFIYLLVMTFIFSCILFFAPGTDARAELTFNNHRFFSSVFFAAAQTIRFFLEWTSSLPLLLLSVLYYYLNKKLVAENRLFAVSFYLSPLYSSMFLFYIIFIAVFPPYWATGILGQHRTLNVAYWLFIILWFINLTVCFNAYKEKLKGIKPLQKQFHTGLIITIIIALAFSKNGYDVITDIFYGKARAYEEQMSDRYHLLQSGADTIYFDPVVDPPKTLFLYEVSGDPANWINRCYNLYFECENKQIIKRKK